MPQAQHPDPRIGDKPDQGWVGIGALEIAEDQPGLDTALAENERVGFGEPLVLHACINGGIDVTC